MNNTVELLGYYGSDEIHACSAWTSTNRDLSDEKKDRIPQLLEMLAKQGHHTPFEKSSLHFLVNTDIATHIHLLKHRIGISINAESARYKELKDDKFYIPGDWSHFWQQQLETYTNQGNELYHQCIKDLEPMLGRKRAKETARYFKTYNSQIQADIMFNFRSFYHFQQLRNSDHAQKEVKDIAQQMLNLVIEIPNNPFKYTINAFEMVEK